MFNLQHQYDMTTLIGRKDELRDINEAFKSKYSEFVAVTDQSSFRATAIPARL